MKRYYKSAALLFTFFMIFTEISFSQTYGQIFTKTEANQKFGVVTSSISISATELKDFLGQTKNVLMFKIKDGNLIVLGDERKILYPQSTTVASIDVFEAFSKSIVSDLLNKDASLIIYIEQRSSVLTLTCGDYTLEQGVGCPPFCP